MSERGLSDCILAGTIHQLNSATAIEKIVLRRIDLPLVTPYHLSYRTFESFEPIVIEIHGENGRIGWGDGHISPGSSAETREGGWTFCQHMASGLTGLKTDEAIERIAGSIDESKVVGSALITALECLEQSPLLDIPHETKFDLLAPTNGTTRSQLQSELEEKLSQGFRTFKVKVGKDVDSDLGRLALIQEIVAGQARLRIDANRAFDREQGCRFASSLDPASVELFEQPCAAEDWQANAAVARVSNVPLMLDEPICSLADIERAADIEGVGFCKLKLKRFGSIACLRRGLERVRELSMEPVLGDGLGSEITAWLEACAARSVIRNAGEFNGFLKPHDRLFANPLHFENGTLVLPNGFRPEIDRKKLNSLTLETREYSSIRRRIPNAS